MAETTKKEIGLRVSNNIPALIDDQFLLDGGVIESLDQIDKSFYQVTNMGSHMKLKDGNSTKLDVSIPFITISSTSTQTILKVIKTLKSKLTKLKIEEIQFREILHFDFDNVLSKTMSKIYENNQVELDQIRLNGKGFGLDIYECSTDRLHVNILNRIAFESDIEIKDLSDDEINKIFNASQKAREFLTNKLDLTHE